ncbi:MFS general substrate transporter [Aspergillus heteromorphus CBS 117.55]|uniref:MFS general substrate transporter n=1 Tax=Aspergillus heteromorphus CBS 117.55 TaxID=1448321 RepID=A0A317WWK5_9EURO|nr:MFS general substrate transporter [Aspergillus heteromorphus CBS 117.55]PWY89198.1 MFS general substrate transporter [Aspergillus heteromorphus CBS 117.55]
MADQIQSSGPGPARNIEAQSAFASTLVADVEKAPHAKEEPSEKQHTNVYGSVIETPTAVAGTDAVYAAKAALLNQALLDMGMGRYQWLLFLITSVGWFLDSFWLMSFTVIAPSSANEAQFFYTDNKEMYLFISLYVGLATGATAWPWMSDFLGRKWIFTSTLVLMGMGGLVGAGMPAFTGLCVVGFVVGFAVAGNQVVDAMILLESLPASHQFLVSMQGALWGLGQLVASAVGCSSPTSTTSCHYVSNKGWRYVWWTFGCMTLFLYLCRFAFPLRETPKYLLSRRRDAEATQLVKDMAAYSKRQTWLNESSFARIDSTVDASARRHSRTKSLLASAGAIGLLVLCLLWSATGLTFILHKTYVAKYLATKGVDVVTATTVTTGYLYARYLYISLCAIPGPIVVGFLVEAKGLGRKRTGAMVAVLTGLFMFLATVARSRDALLAFECVLAFLQASTMAVLVNYTVEVFATPFRGLGLGVVGLCWGVFGLLGQVVATFDASVAGGAAVWFCGALWVVLGGAWWLVPETRGRAAA